MLAIQMPNDGDNMAGQPVRRPMDSNEGQNNK
jgi:hypothetical protein